MADPFTIRIANDLSELSRLSGAVGAYLQPHGLPAKTLHVVDLALEEMVTNIVKYGFDDQAQHEIAILVDVTPDGVALQLEDDGHEFNPLEQDDPDVELDLEDRPIGGLGIFLVRRMLGAVAYERRDGRNILKMLVRREEVG